jgi:hypothetical protein
MSGWVAGAVVVGAAINSNAMSNASSSAANSAANANATNWNMYNQNVARMDPYVQAGAGSANALAAWNAPGGQGSQQFNYQDYMNTPGYQFQLQQGQQALDRSLGSRGVGVGTGEMQAQQQYGQGLASQYYQQAFGNFQTSQTNRFNQLASVAGMGENAAAGVGNNGLQTANISGQNSMNAAGGQIAASNSQANNLTGSINSLSNYYQMQQLMGNGNNQNGGGGTGGMSSGAGGAQGASDYWGNPANTYTGYDGSIINVGP